jgi:thymidylate synthase
MVKPNICSTCIYFYFSDSCLLRCAANPLACENCFCSCSEWQPRHQSPTLDLKNFYQIISIQTAGYRIEWWGEDGMHFWDYRKFETVSEAQVAALAAIAQYSFNGDCGEAYPVNNDLSENDTFYRLWLICTSWEEALELIDPQTNNVYRFAFRDENGPRQKEIERAKNWIDAFEEKRSPMSYQIESGFMVTVKMASTPCMHLLQPSN